jgi:hypothetical protein
MPPTKLVDCSVPFYNTCETPASECHQRSWWIVQILSGVVSLEFVIKTSAVGPGFITTTADENFASVALV